MQHRRFSYVWEAALLTLLTLMWLLEQLTTPVARVQRTFRHGR